MRLTMLLLTVALLGACATTGAVIDPAQVCAGWRPICTGQGDTLTEQTAAQIEAHNLFGLKQQCWRRDVCGGPKAEAEEAEGVTPPG